MAKISLEKLREKFQSGIVSGDDLRRALAGERDNAGGILTMPTLGVNLETRNRQAAARAELDIRENDAPENIRVLETVMNENGISTETYLCGDCGKHRISRTCSMCYIQEWDD